MKNRLTKNVVYYYKRNLYKRRGVQETKEVERCCGHCQAWSICARCCAGNVDGSLCLKVVAAIHANGVSINLVHRHCRYLDMRCGKAADFEGIGLAS